VSGAEPPAWLFDLSRLEDAPPDPPSVGLGFTYPGRVHLRSGEPESFKTLVSYLDGAAELERGESVLLVDLEMGPRLARNMLRDIGVTEEQLARQVLYLNPAEPIDDSAGLAALEDLLYDRRPSLVIVDSFDAALELHGLDPNKGRDVQQFKRVFINRFTNAGAATTIIDHAAKNPETRGRFSIGSQRKLGVVDVHLALDAKIPLQRGCVGVVRITTKRDRIGSLSRPHVGELHLTSDPATHRITWQLRAATDETADPRGEWQPTYLMQKVSDWLERQAEPVTRNAIEKAGLGKQAKYVRQALDALIAAGHVAETRGPRNARLCTLVTPFTSSSSDFVSPRLDEVAFTSSSSSLSTRDEDRDEDEVERLADLAREAIA
jgi:hypothetical protein